MKLQKLKSLYLKIKNKLSDGSMDSYHYQELLYCLTPMSLMLFFALEMFILSTIINNFKSTIRIVFELLTGSTFLLLNVYLLIFFIRKIVSFFKRKYILISFLILPTIIILLMTALFWFSVVLADVHNFLVITFNFNIVGIFPYEAIKPVTNTLTTVVQVMMIFFVPISISLLMNSFLPEPLQKKEISQKQKFMRMSIKLSILTIAIILSILFSIINKDNFGSISLLTTLFTFLCTPKTILRLFSNQKNLENKKISDEILTLFDYIKFFYYEFIFAWSISIYIFNPEKTDDRIIIFFITFFILVIPTMAIQLYLKKAKSDFFSKWLVDNEEDETKKLRE